MRVDYAGLRTSTHQHRVELDGEPKHDLHLRAEQKFPFCNERFHTQKHFKIILSNAVSEVAGLPLKL